MGKKAIYESACGLTHVTGYNGESLEEEISPAVVHHTAFPKLMYNDKVKKE